MTIRWYDDDPKLLRAAIDFTATQSGFPARLVEKDYFCSVALEYLTAGDATLAFKGGTCLAKIYTSFYRLSEDLDFSISIPADASRANRRKHVACLEEVIAELPFALPALRMYQSLHGAQYIRNRAFNDAHYKQMVIEYLKKYGRASRREIDALLIDNLSDVLGDEQKRNKVRNLLYAMSRRDKTIRNTGSGRHSVWVRCLDEKEQK